MGRWVIPPEVHGNGRFVIPRREFVPAYLKTYEEGRLKEKVEEALSHLGPSCRVCPRLCKGVNRLENAFGVCRVGRYARVASAFPHFGEEDVLRGWRGSGTIFFSWCNLRCVFCVAPETMIATEEGPLPIREIYERGDRELDYAGGQVRFFEKPLRVFTRLGRLACVSKAFRHPFEGHLIQIQPYYCPPLLLTPNHEVFAVHPSAPDQVRKIRADQLTREHWLLVPKRIGWEPIERLEVRGILSQEKVRFRKMTHRLPMETLISLFSQPISSNYLALLTGYHPAYVRKLRGMWRRGLLNAETFATNDLVVEGKTVRFKTEKRPGIPSHIPLTPDLAWLLGIYCAEGHVTKSRDRLQSYRLIFSFGLHEGRLANGVAQILKRRFGVQPRQVRRRTTITVEVGKTSLALLFAKLCGFNSHSKRVPLHLLRSSDLLLRYFLRGLLTGDGHTERSYEVLTTVSRNLAFGIFEVGLRLNSIPAIYKWNGPPISRIEGRKIRQSPIFIVKIPKKGLRRYFYRDAGDFYLIPIREIRRKSYKGWVYNLEISDPDHSYVASFVAVSNCQNYEISQLGEGEELTPKELARLMIRLQEMGCHNINFVTPEHVVPQIVEALPYAIEMGLRVPLVYNTSAYDSLESLRVMEGLVDIYMPDFKLWTPERSRKYLLAANYPEVARQVIAEMHRQVGELRVDEDGLAVRGVLVRHLVMPGLLDETREIMRWLAGLSRDTYVNLMDQYYPAWKAKTDPRYAEINRRVFRREMEEAFRIAREAGLWRFDVRWRMVIPGLEWIAIE